MRRDGRLVGVPHRQRISGASRPRSSGCIPVALENWRGFLFVTLEPGAPSVAEMMAPYEDEVAPYRFEDLRVMGRVTLRPRPLNWKTIADNYSDHLHIPVGHPGPDAAVRPQLPDRGAGRMSTGWKATWSRRNRPTRPSAPTSGCCRAVDHLPATHQRKWLYYKLFPNVAFDIYPDQVDFMQFLPVSATETVIREISYALPDDRREMKAARYLNWRINRRVNAEDTELITRVQLGMQSPSYEAGPLGTSEVCLRSFARKLRRLIPEARLGSPPPPGWSRLANSA